MPGPHLTRKEFLASAIAAAASTTFAQDTTPPRPGEDITEADLRSAEKLFGLEFTEEERKAVLASVRSSRRTYDALRAQPITYQIEPPTIFEPLSKPPSGKPKIEAKPTRAQITKRPKTDIELVHLSIRDLGHLLRTRQITSTEVTNIYLDRCAMYGDKLLNVVSITTAKAKQDAAEADRMIRDGKYLGPLHGVPYGLKDLFATKGHTTTWGSEPHKDQRFDFDATVVEKLTAAGAVLVAKTSLGSLAMGDMWFKGRTKNPWNAERGSSGSSAGSASGVAAGLFAFGIGTETLGSIMSPSHECRVTGLRPTYGRVSRYGGMAVSWTMDKVGPICREAEDCALVLASIAGADPKDRTAVDRDFVWPARVDLKKLKIGFLIGANDDPKDRSRLERDDYLKTLAKLGANLEPVKFDPLPQGVSMILGVEAAAAFDDFTRSDRDDLLKNSTWPAFYRQNRFVPAVEYLQAQRARTLAMRRFEEQLGDFDMIVANERGAALLTLTNYTGHPQMLVPNGVDERGNQRSVSFFGRLFDEARLVAVAKLFQDATGFHKLHPADPKI